MNMLRARDEGNSQLLREAAWEAGYDHEPTIDLAIAFVFEQCGSEEDFETMEATMLARLEDTEQTGER